MQKSIGSIDIGKEADLILLSLDSLGMSPYNTDMDNLASLIVNSAQEDDIEMVFSNGEV